MNLREILLGLFLASLPCLAQSGINPRITGEPNNLMLTWDTQSNFMYQIEVSPNLLDWFDTGILEQGTGGSLSYGFMADGGRTFLRIRETSSGGSGGNFLVAPQEGDQIIINDGVCFGLSLNGLGSSLTKIRLAKRRADSLELQQIGTLDEFDIIDRVGTLRGSAVWIPEPEDLGDWVVSAIALDDMGAVISSASRAITLIENSPPTIEITNGPDPAAEFVEFVFETNVNDPDSNNGDRVVKVEFYNNGKLVGVDGIAPFGDQLFGLEGRSLGFDIELRNGTHNITARVFDSHGAIGETTQPFVLTRTNDFNGARPEISLITPSTSEITITKGNTFTVDYSVSDPDDDLFFVELTDASDRTDDGDGGVFERRLAFDSSSPYTAFTVNTNDFELGKHILRLEALDGFSNRSLPEYFIVNVVDNSTLPVLAANLVQAISDNSVAVSNEIFSGQTFSSQIFSGGSVRQLEVEDGALLTTGYSPQWNQINQTEEFDEKDTNAPIKDLLIPGDDQAQALVGGAALTFDAALLEFDVFSPDGQLEIDYQFCSEEWIEYVSGFTTSECFNDLFLITINEIPISYTPDCESLISVNSIRPAISEGESNCLQDTNLAALRAHLYIDNRVPQNSDDPAPPIDVEYDGLSVRLRAHAFVEPGAIHRVKIAIADANDDQFDSALFVEQIRSLPSVR